MGGPWESRHRPHVWHDSSDSCHERQPFFAGGYLKSTLDPEAAGFVESPTDSAVSGPYTTSDWNGTNAQTITVDLKSHPTPGGAAENAGGSWCACEAGVVKIDKTTASTSHRLCAPQPNITHDAGPLFA